MRIACVMMQKNEDELLRPWLAYHSYLFSPENLYVFDNEFRVPYPLSAAPGVRDH
jgi:hypothetical protein